MNNNKLYYSSYVIIVILPISIILSFVVLSSIFGIDAMNKNYIDKIYHFIGGFSILSSICGILWKLSKYQILKINDKITFYICIIGMSISVITGWEIFEYYFIYPILPKYLNYADTINDILVGLCGSLVALLFIRWESFNN